MDREYLPGKDVYLRRPRVDALLEKAMAHYLVTVVAGPGYGKTYAMAGYARQMPQRLVWLRLLELDNDTERFWKAFVAAIRRELPELAESLGRTGFPATPAQLDSFMRLTVDALYSGPPVVLVLDEFECLQNPEVLAFFDLIIRSEVENFTLVLLSGRKISFEAAHQCGDHFRVTDEDLQFTEAEMEQLFAMRGVALPRQELKRLWQATDGWPLALWLLVSRYEKGGVQSGTATHLQLAAELFEHSYYANYPAELRHLLVRLSLFPHFPVELVRRLCRGDVEGTTEQLADNIFVHYDYVEGLFSYQKMYREFLAQKLALLPPGEMEEPLRLAGDWFLQNGYPYEAADCYWRQKDYDRYLQCLRQLPICRQSAQTTGQVLEKLNQLPADYAKKNPLVDFSRAFMYLNNLEVHRARQILERLVERLKDKDDEESRQMLGDSYVALLDIAQLLNGDTGFAYLPLAAPLLPQGCCIRSADLLLVANNSAFFLPDSKPGSLQRMVGLFYEWQPCSDAILRGSGYGFEHLFAAEAELLRGDWGKARDYAHRAIQKAQTENQHDIVCHAYWVQIRQSLFAEGHEAALAWLEEMEAYVTATGADAVYELRDDIVAWLYIRLGQLERVPNWVAANGLWAADAPLGLGLNWIVRAQYLLAAQQPEKAFATLTHMDRLFYQRGLWSEKLQTYILRAVCLLAGGEDREALSAFWQAYQMSHQNGITTLFLEAGSPVCELVAAVREQDEFTFDDAWLEQVEAGAGQYAKRLAAMAKTAFKEKNPSGLRGVTLTGRENEVLRLLAQGLTRDEIGNLMQISINGVKKHITGIYTKLGAVNRADAIHIATSGGLLEA